MPMRLFDKQNNCSSRIFAQLCASCGKSITPMEGTEDTVRVVAMGKDFHVDCYICEVIEAAIRYFSLGK
jgi:hypothetical protein